MSNPILLGSSKKIHNQLPEFPTESKTLRSPQGRLGANQAAGKKLTPVGREVQGHTIFSKSFTPWAWAQELSSTIQLLEQSLVLPWHGKTCLLLNHPNHCPGGITGQQPFPVGILDIVKVTRSTEECNGIDMARYCPVSLSQRALAQPSWLALMLLRIPASRFSLHSMQICSQTTGKLHLFPLQNFQQYHQEYPSCGWRAPPSCACLPCFSLHRISLFQI